MAENLPKWVKMLSNRINITIIFPLILWIFCIPIAYLIKKNISYAVLLVFHSFFSIAFFFSFNAIILQRISRFIYFTDLSAAKEFDYYYCLSKKLFGTKSFFVFFFGCIRLLCYVFLCTAILGGLPAAFFLLMHNGSFYF